MFDIMGGDDSMIVRTLNYLFSFYSKLVHVVNDLDQVQILSPNRTLFHFLSFIDFQSSMMLEYLISQETIDFLSYLVSICDHILGDWELFQLELGESYSLTAVSSTLVPLESPKQQQQQQHIVVHQYQMVLHTLSNLYHEIARIDRLGLFPYQPGPLLDRLKLVSGVGWYAEKPRLVYKVWAADYRTRADRFLNRGRKS